MMKIKIFRTMFPVFFASVFASSGCKALNARNDALKAADCLGFTMTANIGSSQIQAFNESKEAVVPEAVGREALKGLDEQIAAMETKKFNDAVLATFQTRFVTIQKSQRDNLKVYVDGSAKLSNPKWVPPKEFVPELEKAAKAADLDEKKRKELMKEVRARCEMK
jgi:hypothetical protein